MPDVHVQINIEEYGDSGTGAGIPFRKALSEIPEGVIGAESDGRLYGLEDPVYHSGQYRLLRLESDRVMELFWHSASHVLAQAVKRLFPHARLGIGPAIKDGFYYDFDFGEPISADELPRIEEEMMRIVEEDLPIKRSELSAEEAKAIFTKGNENYKLELIEGLSEQISTYLQGEFTDLCRGPHLPSTGLIKHFKLLSITGAYWRGDERNPMLQRIYGTAYPTAKLLRAHMQRLEEAKKRDHRLIGKQLGLFSFHYEAPGTAFWHEKGLVLFNIVQDYWREAHSRHGYVEVRTPIVLSRELWERSGHWDHYRNSMYVTVVDDVDFAVKPMNCPGTVLMYTERQFSYRDLPWRVAELGSIHRFEKSGTLHGLFRVRGFTMDDAHIFCTPGQLVDEVRGVINLVYEIYNRFGLTEVEVELSTRPADRIGTDEMWDRAERDLTKALKTSNIEFDVNEGEGAFYGPKIDFHIFDCLGRRWQCGTVQIDFNFPERFNLEYVGSDNESHRPVMIHRAILGSMERFIGILIEHYAGDFPLWLAPEQAVVAPITDKEHEASLKIHDRLISEGIRCRIDYRAEKIGRKIRDAELAKVPYMLIIGAREAESGQVSLRLRKQGDQGTLSVDDLIERMKAEISGQLS